MKPEKIKEVLRMVNVSSVISIIEQGIEMEKLSLEVNEYLMDEYQRDVILNKLADGKIFLSLLRRDILFDS